MNSASLTISRGPSHPLGLPLRDWLLYAYAVVSPFFVFAVFFTRDTAANWVVAVMLLLMLVDIANSGGNFWFDRTILYMLVLLLMYLVATMGILLEEPANTWAGRTPLERAIGIDVRLAIVVVSFLAFVHHLADAPLEVFMRILRMQFLIGVLLAAFGIIQYVTYALLGSSALIGIESTNEAFSLRSTFVRIGKERVFRTSAVFSEPSYFGFFLVPLLVKSVVAFQHKLYFGSRTIHRFMVLCFLTALVTNFTFTAIVSLLGVGVLIAVAYIRRAPRTAIALISITTLFLGFLLLSPLGGGFLGRLSEIVGGKDLSTIARFLSAYLGFVAFWDNPIFGLGPGGFAFFFAREGILVGTKQMHTPLNVWFSVLTDVGLVGFVPFLALLLNIMRRAIKGLRQHPLVEVYLWSAISYLLLLTTADLWFLDMFWFELAILLILCSSPSIRSTGHHVSTAVRSVP